MNPVIILWFIILLIIEASALYCVRRSSDNKQYGYLVLSCLFYACIPLLLYLILIKTHKIASLNCSWNVASSIYGLIIGMLIFSEIYTTRQCFGVGLGILSLLLMNL